MYSRPRVAAERGECRVAVLCLDSEEYGASVSERERPGISVSRDVVLGNEPGISVLVKVSERDRESPRL